MLADAYRIESVAHETFSHIVGHLRGSTLAQRQAHAQRLALSPVPFQAFVVKNAEGTALACGQFSIEAELVGLYDVFTEPASRSLGLARTLCEHMLTLARSQAASVGYLQVDGDNHAARRIYQRLGFSDAYAYHYRQQPEPCG